MALAMLGFEAATGSKLNFQMKLTGYLWLLLVFALPDVSFACRPKAGYHYVIPSKEERYAKADLVLVGRVVKKEKISRIIGVADLQPSTYLLDLEVETWLKGAEEQKIEVIDNAGTDCDDLLGVDHVVMHSDALSGKWLVYLRRADGRYWITTAERVK